MTTKAAYPTLTCGRLFLVTGITSGREVFLGKALSEPEEGRITLEGRSIGRSASGELALRPFATRVSFTTFDPDVTLHHVFERDVLAEGLELLRCKEEVLAAPSHPLFHRWIDASIPGLDAGFEIDLAPSDAPDDLYGTFRTSLEGCRRLLYAAPQVGSTRELDRLAELEGDLVIELGKSANGIAVQLHEVLETRPDLGRFLASCPEPRESWPTPLGPWQRLSRRLQQAKQWALRRGDVDLVRTVNALVREGTLGTDGILLEHVSALDALTTEAFDHYGIYPAPSVAEERAILQPQPQPKGPPPVQVEALKIQQPY